MERYLSPLPISVFVHDHTVDIGLPEHLEPVARQLKAEGSVAPSFDGFLTGLGRAVELAGDHLVELESHTPFLARMDSEHNLTIETPDASWCVELEDLRGVWVSLLKGLVTREQAGWSIQNGADPLLTILSLLPQVRPIEIQRQAAAHPELAVELRPEEKRTVLVPPAGEQRELAWA
jgi:hypothetical protein